MLRVDKETLFYPLNANTEKIKVLFIYLKPPLSKVLKFFASIFLKYCLVTVVLPGKHQNNFRETWRDHRRLTLKGIPPSDLNIYYSTENPTRPCTFDRRKSRSVSFRILWPRRPGKKPCRCNEPHRFREKLLKGHLLWLHRISRKAADLQCTEDVESIYCYISVNQRKRS